MSNKIAIVTGASRGIGAASAKLLGEKGYAVCVNYLSNSAKAEAIANSIIKEGGRAIIVQADISQETDVFAMFERVDTEFGPVTALVNNAGISGGTQKVEDITLEKLQLVFSVNVFGVFMCAREALKRMKHVGGGSIVNVSSEAGKFGGNNLAHYAASKAAINAFTIGLAREAAPYDVRVNAVSPGVIDTDANSKLSSERLAFLKKSLPMGRMGLPLEVAETVLWLLSKKSSYVSGAIISVAGGR
jgi:NAD(P)-dependent dehydrogenase (short-subunit alcohol dehydrogenase family)